MTSSASPLATEKSAHDGDAVGEHPTGILPGQKLRELIAAGAIRAETAVTDKQIQPASLDLRLGPIAYRVQASFLPGAATVADKIARYGQYEMDLTQDAVLERGCVYIVPLMESLALPDNISGAANPKSSTGRLDIFTRIITDNSSEFDRIRNGYNGGLYAEISPRTFSVKVRQGTTLSQLRLRRGPIEYSDAALRLLQEQRKVVDTAPGAENISRGIAVSIDLAGDAGVDGVIGYKAKRDAGVIDYDLPGQYDAIDFWEPIYASKRRAIVLNLDDFYILASKEAIAIPEDHAAEMVAYDTLVGEFRVHYAGFFDPGFGHSALGAEGTRAVLEVRPHEVPFMVEDGQVVGRLLFERLVCRPEKLYGADIGSSYQRQGLALSKHFKR